MRLKRQRQLSSTKVRQPMTVTRYLGGTRRKLADWAGIQKQDPRTKVGKTLDFHSSNTSLPRLPSRNAMPATGESKLWVVYNCFLRKHVQQRPTDKTSFWMQFEKRGRGLLQEAEWDWGRVSYWLKARRGNFFPSALSANKWLSLTPEKLDAVTHVLFFQTAYMFV